ncbi:hypothetical protein DFQ28_006270 [Apophysomyces sp. BC1034]|nr:hypothetical protein DFQ29_005079 [Apophysomyces sp. BC1021]KAG0187492.1 hypothetical protein DFQ28_006270 [Apophysomyces sp. BC1034]
MAPYFLPQYKMLSMPLWQDVKDLFRNAGNILRADVAQAPDGRSKGYGTVLFATHEDARKAMVMYNGFEFHGRQLRVHFDKFAPGAVLPNQHLFQQQSQPQNSQQIQQPRYSTMGLDLRPPQLPAFENLNQSYMPPAYPTTTAAFPMTHAPPSYSTALLHHSQSSHRPFTEDNSQLGFNSLVDPFPPTTMNFQRVPLYTDTHPHEESELHLPSDLSSNAFGSLGVSVGDSKTYANMDMGTKIEAIPIQQRPSLFTYPQSTKSQVSFPAYQWNPPPSSGPVTPLQEEPIPSSQPLYLSSPNSINATTMPVTNNGILLLTDAMKAMGLTDGSAGLTVGRKGSSDRLLDSSNGVWNPLGGFKM